MPVPREPSGDPATPFLRGLRTAVAVIGAAVLIPSGLVRHLGLYHPLWVQLAAYAALGSIVLTEIVLIRRRRSWGAWRWPALALALTATTAAQLSVPAAYVVSAANWAFGAVGWSLLILLLDRPIAWLVSFLAVHEVLTWVVVMASSTPGAGLTLIVGSVGALGFPLACGVASSALRAVSLQAEDAAARAEEIRVAEAVAEGLDEDRRRRLADLYDSAVPLLQGLADGSLLPGDPDVQRSCAVEAARMRRLFAEADETADPLLHELRHCADIAERRGVVVEFEMRGRQHEPPVEVRRALTEAPLAALATAATHARITLLGTNELLAVSVIADSGPVEDRQRHASAEVDVHVAHNPAEDRTWVETRWTPRSPSSSSTTTSPSATA